MFAIIIPRNIFVHRETWW